MNPHGLNRGVKREENDDGFLEAPFPKGAFTLKAYNNKFLTAGTDGKSLTFSVSNVNDSTKWIYQGDHLVNVGTKLALQVDGELVYSTPIIQAQEQKGDPKQVWSFSKLPDATLPGRIRSSVKNLVLTVNAEENGCYLIEFDPEDISQDWTLE
ncbi:unnamed protein product [Cunninghamella blakesleeana]